ncbi:MAG: hypothetical protein GY872_10895 [Roseibacillus sp.]|jgi:hypothetical protein|nr:hypothetical protein [Roseibacillus sp.]HJM62366.1 hypothetical protein [Roseibacillus sp.]|tara:strand:+ start:8855 stop:9070 length:216 start_codon:yes stop_codon:yes gene_type:complete
MKGGMFNCPECRKLQSAGRHWHDSIWSACYWGGVVLGSGLGIAAILNDQMSLGIAILAVTGITAAIASVWG